MRPPGVHDRAVGKRDERHPHRRLGGLGGDGAAREHRFQERQAHGAAHALAGRCGGSVAMVMGLVLLRRRRLRNGSLVTIAVTRAEKR